MLHVIEVWTDLKDHDMVDELIFRGVGNYNKCMAKMYTFADQYNKNVRTMKDGTYSLHSFKGINFKVSVEAFDGRIL